ncbi:hypothetical protein FAZ19_00005 [Sphingobacterium alkalisoli]|uniref:Uncharacterized protein n=1 Tax=Sphingobacterium alkalisoli TaxID=1874115 RepID=A0A4U0H787_9SPHI|nr:hypothetical protein [Sphingobacterium alkalisoli]TJY67685.1 hypothetical protein FAZ19_00005 [Sphingobacterium alkalisoli]GGH12002.1 hypothetical protein GCM10011418_11270 [Sphingobacterium alkalisoli]
MRSIINKISQALQVVLLAPIKLPGKALNILKYVAVGLGIIESVLDDGKQESETGDRESDIRDQEKDAADITSIDVGDNGGSKNKDHGLKMDAEETGEDDGGGKR